MKAVLAPCLAIVLASCVSAPLRYTTTLDDTHNDGVVRISLLGLLPQGSRAPEGLTVQCEDTGTTPVAIKWDKSSIILDSDAQPVYLETSSYGDPYGVRPESVVRAGSRMSATVYPANRVSSTAGGWGPPKLAIQPFNARQVWLRMCVNVSGEDRFYTLKVTLE